VRDTARWFDVSNGHDHRDPLSLSKVTGWEEGLGSHLDELHGRRAVIVPDWGGATVAPAMCELLEDAARTLVHKAGHRVVNVDTSLPNTGAAWSISGMLGVYDALDGRWPECAGSLTPEMRAGLQTMTERYGVEARRKIERRSVELNERMADVFEQTDFVITASNPDVAFAAEGPLPSEFGGIRPAPPTTDGSRSLPISMAAPPFRSPPARSMDCPSASRSWPGISRSRSCSTARC
jgi:aspartyl-tRNA(Asn)/glutamyl-tRNA(Gln) amidotransferase subunit A